MKKKVFRERYYGTETKAEEVKEVKAKPKKKVKKGDK